MKGFYEFPFYIYGNVATCKLSAYPSKNNKRKHNRRGSFEMFFAYKLGVKFLLSEV